MKSVQSKLLTFLRWQLLILPFALFTHNAMAALPVIDYASLVKLVSQLEQLKQQTQYLQAELKPLAGTQYQWSHAQTLMNQLDNVLQQTQGISYQATQLNKLFQSTYPGYQAPTNVNAQYQANVKTALNTLNGTLQAMQLSAHDVEKESTRLDFLQQQAQTAQGQTQAIQASAQIASEMVSQLQLLRQTLMLQVNAQAAVMATQMQEKASQKASFDKVIQAGTTDIPHYGQTQNELTLPPF